MWPLTTPCKDIYVDFVMLLSSRAQNSNSHQRTATVSDAEATAAGSSHVPQSTDAQATETLGELSSLDKLNDINWTFMHL